MDIGCFAFLRMHVSLDGKVMLEDELQRIYDNEINVRISWLWDGGIDVRLGDEVNGYVAEENASSTGDIVSRPESGQPVGCSGRRSVVLRCDARIAARCMQLQLARKSTSRLFAHCGKGVEVPRPRPM
jgi:hypothetical protein